jgi:hypothetical protein
MRLSLDLGLGSVVTMGGVTPPEWVGGSSFVADYANNQYWISNREVASSEAVSCVRSTAAHALSSTDYDSFAANAARITDLSLTVEPTRTPGMRYSADQSNAAWTAEAGLTKSAPGGAAPITGSTVTRLTWASGNGRLSATRDITSGQTVRVQALVHLEPQVPASNPARYGIFRMSWASVGAATNYNYVFDITGGVAGFQGTGSSNAAITEVFPDRYLLEFDLLCASTLTVQTLFFYCSNRNVTNDTFLAPNAALTWDVAYIDAINGAGTSTPIVSLATLTARAADADTYHLPASGTGYMTHQFDNGEIQTIATVSGGDYAVPTNLDRIAITRSDWGLSPRGLVFMGDSLTAGTGATNATFAYPAIAAAAFNPDRWFLNSGVGGNTSSQVLTRYLALDAEAKMQTLIIWVGRNNYADTAQIISDIDAMIAEAGHDRYLVLNVLKASIDDTEFSIPQINTTNAALLSNYGGKCLDILGYLVSLGAPGGAHPDAVAYAGGYPPDDVSVDTGVHLNDLGYGYVGAFVANVIKARRW